MKKVDSILLVCNNCKKEFYRKSYLAKTSKVYCSHTCQVKSKFYFGHPSYVNNTGANSYAWKGDMVGYGSLHQWVNRKKGKPSKCEFCGKTDKTKYEWANKSHEYKRDLTDWIRLCVPCHSRYDEVDIRARERMLHL